MEGSMSDLGFDRLKAHQYFSADCFNRAWQLIEKPDRTRGEDEQMIGLTHSSLWHWTQREDCTKKNLSIGYWQLARIYTIVGRPVEAKHYAQLCLEHSQHEEPFFLGYAYEALARAEKLAGNDAIASECRATAAHLAETVQDAEERKLLMDDLNTLW
jgi:hypothetical protein